MRCFSAKYIFGLISLLSLLPALLKGQPRPMQGKACEDLFNSVTIELGWIKPNANSYFSKLLGVLMQNQDGIVVLPGHPVRFFPADEIVSYDSFFMKEDPTSKKYYREGQALIAVNNSMYIKDGLDQIETMQHLYRIDQKSLNLVGPNTIHGKGKQHDVKLTNAILNLPAYPLREYKNQDLAISFKYALDVLNLEEGNFLMRSHLPIEIELKDLENVFGLDRTSFQTKANFNFVDLLSKDGWLDQSQVALETVRKLQLQAKGTRSLLLTDLGIKHQISKNFRSDWPVIKIHLQKQRPIIIDLLVNLKRQDQLITELNSVKGNLNEAVEAMNDIYVPSHGVKNQKTIPLSVVAVGFLEPLSKEDYSGGYLVVMGANSSSQNVPVLWPVKDFKAAFEKENIKRLMKSIGFSDESIEMGLATPNLILVGTD